MTLRSNLAQVFVPVTIHDLRGKEKSVNLDTNGLEVLEYHGNIQEEGSEAQHTYYEEIGDLLKERLGSSRVIIYHHTYRSRSLPRID